jgi:hypothetical protein
MLYLRYNFLYMKVFLFVIKVKYSKSIQEISIIYYFDALTILISEKKSLYLFVILFRIKTIKSKRERIENSIYRLESASFRIFRLVFG